MIALPHACSACRRTFDPADARRRMVLLENRYALCSECEWTAGHPEARRAATRQVRLAHDPRPALAAG